MRIFTEVHIVLAGWENRSRPAAFRVINNFNAHQRVRAPLVYPELRRRARQQEETLSFLVSAHKKNQASFRDRVQALIVGASQHGIDLLAELLGVGGGLMCFERLAVLPDLDQSEVVYPRNLNIDFHA